MRVAVFGLGYVGSVSAGELRRGWTRRHRRRRESRESRRRQQRPQPDRRAGSRCAAPGRRRCASSASDDEHVPEAIADTDLSLICVGTPSRKNGSLDLSYLIRVCEQIGDALRDKPTYHVVVVRSTVLPGTTHEHVIPTLEATFGQEIRRRVRRLREPGVPARGNRAQGLPPAAADARRPQPCRGRSADQGALRQHRGAALQHQHPRRRDDEATRATRGTR